MYVYVSNLRVLEGQRCGVELIAASHDDLPFALWRTSAKRHGGVFGSLSKTFWEGHHGFGSLSETIKNGHHRFGSLSKTLRHGERGFGPLSKTFRNGGHAFGSLSKTLWEIVFKMLLHSDPTSATPLDRDFNWGRDNSMFV